MGPRTPGQGGWQCAWCALVVVATSWLAVLHSPSFIPFLLETFVISLSDCLAFLGGSQGERLGFPRFLIYASSYVALHLGSFMSNHTHHHPSTHPLLVAPFSSNSQSTHVMSCSCHMALGLHALLEVQQQAVRCFPPVFSRSCSSCVPKSEVISLWRGSIPPILRRHQHSAHNEGVVLLRSNFCGCWLHARVVCWGVGRWVVMLLASWCCVCVCVPRGAFRYASPPSSFCWLVRFPFADLPRAFGWLCVQPFLYIHATCCSPL